MYYIKVGETNTCKECKIKTYVDIDSISIRQEQIMICSYTGNTINENTLDKDCPIKELKPKELKFTKYSENVWLCGNFNFLYEKKAKRYYCYYNFIKIDEAYSVKDSIKYCQEFANKLFYEMIGE